MQKNNFSKQKFLELLTTLQFYRLCFSCTIFSLLAASQLNGQTCGWDAAYNLQLQDPTFVSYMQQMTENTEEAVQRMAGENENLEVEIPIIFHIVHKGTSPGNGDNIDYQDVVDAFNRLNADFINTDISFCLAQRDELGNQLTEPGVVRVDASSIPEYMSSGITIGAPVEYDVKTLGTQFSNYSYCNVWVVSNILGQNTNGQIQGVGYFPNTVDPAIDGIMMRHSIFNQAGNRVLTHEAGHFMGLFHTFTGDDPDYDGANYECPADGDFPFGDGISDTDPHIRSASGTCPSGPNPCVTGGLLENVSNNHMDYSDESCRMTFTDEQIASMKGTVDCHRKGLTHSLGCNLGCNPIFVVDFTHLPLNPVAPDQNGNNAEPGVFTAGSNLSVYDWFVDGVKQEPGNTDLSYTFDIPGDHIICLEAIQNGCKIQTCKTIRVHLAELCFDPFLDPCEMLLNGNFEQQTPILQNPPYYLAEYSYQSDYNYDKICNWTDPTGSAALYLSLDNDRFLLMSCLQENLQGHAADDALVTYNPMSLVHGTSYRLSFEYFPSKVNEDQMIEFDNITIGLVEDFENINNVYNLSNLFDIPGIYINSTTWEGTDFGWIEEERVFVYDQFTMGQYLYVHGNTSQDSDTHQNWFMLKDVSITPCNVCEAVPYFEYEGECGSFTFEGVDKTEGSNGIVSWSINGSTVPSATGNYNFEFNFPYEGNFEVCMNITCPNGSISEYCQTVFAGGVIITSDGAQIACEICQNPLTFDVGAQRCGEDSKEFVVQSFPITVPKGYRPCLGEFGLTQATNGSVQTNDYYVDNTGQNEDIIYVSFIFLADDPSLPMSALFAMCSPDGTKSECFQFRIVNPDTCDECIDDPSIIADMKVECNDSDLSDDVFNYTGSFTINPPEGTEGCGYSSNSAGLSNVGVSGNAPPYNVSFDISTNQTGTFNSNLSLCFYDPVKDKKYCYNVDIRIENPCVPTTDDCEYDIPPVTIYCDSLKDGEALFNFSYALHLPDLIKDGYRFCDTKPIESEDGLEILFTNVGIGAYIFGVELLVPCDRVTAGMTTVLTLRLCNAEGKEICVKVNFTLDCPDCPSNKGGQRNATWAETNYSIYPNPASTAFTVFAPKSLNSQSFEMYNSIGELVMKGDLQNGANLVKSEHLLSGLYIIKLTNGEDIRLEKILIAR